MNQQAFFRLKYSNYAWLILLLTMVSCVPQSKEDYLERYKEFIADVSQDYEHYTEEDWEESLEQYHKFSGEWYSKFKEELTWKEQLLVGKYEVQYNMMRVKETTVNFYDTFLKDDFEELKEQVEYYYENNMKDDIERLVQQAEEIGDSAISIMRDILEELEIEMEELFE